MNRDYIRTPIRHFAPHLLTCAAFTALFVVMALYVHFETGIILAAAWTALLAYHVALIVWHQNQDDRWFREHMFDREDGKWTSMIEPQIY